MKWTPFDAMTQARDLVEKIRPELERVLNDCADERDQYVVAYAFVETIGAWLGKRNAPTGVPETRAAAIMTSFLLGLRGRTTDKALAHLLELQTTDPQNPLCRWMHGDKQAALEVQLGAFSDTKPPTIH